LRERLERERQKRDASSGFAARVESFTAGLRAAYDTRPVTRAEWDAACGDEE